MRRVLSLVWASILCLMMVSSAVVVIVQSDDSPAPSPTARCRGGSSERTVLVEVNTAKWCYWCPGQKHSLERLYNEVGSDNLVILEYHGSTSDNLTSPYSQQRRLFYRNGGLAYPAVGVDGGGPYNDDHLWESGTDQKYGKYDEDKAMYQEEKQLNAMSNITISLSGNITSTTVYVKAHILATDPITLSNLKVRFVLYHNNIYHRDGNTNENAGILHRVFNHVVMDGKETALPPTFNSGDMFDAEQTFAINPPQPSFPTIDKRELGVGVFVQTDNKVPWFADPNRYNAEVLQAASIEFVDTPTVLINKDMNDAIDEGFDRYDEFLTKAGLNHRNWDTLEMFETEMMNMRTPPTYTDVENYAVQLWFTGTSGGTFDVLQRSCIDSGLAADQGIFVVGEEIAYEAFIMGYLNWLQSSLHANFQNDNSGAVAVDGVPADPITNGMFGKQIYGSDPDEISLAPGGLQIFTYSGLGTIAGLRAEHDLDSGVVYMAFNYFEGISSYNGDPNFDADGETLMRNVFAYLDSIEAPRVDVLQPDGGEVLNPGQQYEIHWSARDVDIPQNGVTIEYTLDSSSPSWVTIEAGEPDDGVHLWNVPIAQTSKARVRVCVLDSTGLSNCAMSDADFTIGTPGDTTPPVISNVLVDGQPSVTVPEGTSVTLTAMISDFFTGGSTIIGANYTIGSQNWPGTGMSAQDGGFGDVSEDVTAPIDTVGWAPGDYDLYVYGCDDVPNCNADSLEYARITISPPDTQPPEITSVAIDGAPSQTYYLSTKPGTVQLTAVVDDSLTGNSNITEANYTTSPGAWPGVPMGAMDGSFNSPIETAYADIPTPGVGTYDYFVYACDAIPHCNNTGPSASLTILDDIPPEISNVLVDGSPSVVITEGTASVALTATIDDATTGGSPILTANYTVGAQAWPGSPMNPTDGAYDTPTEDVDATVDTSLLTPGSYEFCVYAVDNSALQNENTTGSCAQLQVVAEVQPPEISTVRIDGQLARTIPFSTLPVTCNITATIDDSTTGGSDIAGANYSTPTPTSWPGNDMAAVDGSFNSPTEDVIASFSAPLTVGTYAYYVYAWDARSNYNNSAPFAFLIIQDDVPPEVSNVLANGMSSITVSQGTLLTLTATVSDAATGNSNIVSANYTEGWANWSSSVSMNATDGGFNSPTENVEATVNTSGWSMGVHDLYVYATDSVGNGNATSVEHVSINITIPDIQPPEILNALVNGNAWVGVNEGDLVVLTATVTDANTGDSMIAGANYTVGVQNWPGVPMNPADGSFNSPFEDVTIDIDTTGWAMANHTICVYAWDIVPNENTTSAACANIEIMALKPLAPLMTGADLAGIGLVDVEIRWDRSGDDGLGRDDVVEYDIYRANSYSGPYVQVTSVPATNSPTYSWTCTGCGVGDSSTYFFYVEADNGALTEPAPNKASKFQMSLSAAPQLISVPVILSSNDVSFVLQTLSYDMAYYYDSADPSDPWKSYMPFKTYKGDLTTVNRTMALWVNVTSPSDFVVAGLVPDTTTITLRAGWNLVGFPSFATTYTVADLKVDVNASSVEEPNPMAPPYCLKEMLDTDAFLAGSGYWIEVPEDIVWTISN
ncbi:MAG: hypothetical protein ACE5QF_00410 [Thermoplasmata archaeon]